MANEATALATRDFATAWLAEREDLVQRATAIAAVDSQESFETAGEVQTLITKAVKRLETERKAVTSPLDDLKKRIMAEEKRLAAPLNEQLARIKAMNTAYATELARRAEAERREQERVEALAAEAAAAAEESDPFGFNGAQAVQAPTPTSVAMAMPRTSSNRMVEHWDFEVVDANAVPRELLSVDECKVRAFLNARRAEGYKADQIAVPGIRITATMQVQAR